MTTDEILDIPPFSLAKAEKEELLTARLLELTKAHAERCPEYAGMLRGAGFSAEKAASWHDLPFLPVSLFKEMDLRSVPPEDVFKTMTSSGTSGQAVSKIYLDRATAAAQQKALVKIVSAFTGAARLPMLIIDSPAVVRDRANFSARGAGILGFSIFGADKAYALNDDMQVDIKAVEAFLEKHDGKRILLFGFTFMVWLHFYKELLRLEQKFDLSKGILIHGGGWKKLAGEAVTKDEFKQSLTDICGLSDIHDYYGMVEQTGSVYMECERGYLHASVFSDIITRRPLDFSPCEVGETGIVQVVSVLPESYPGHSLLTEDEGAVLGEDGCPCGRKGKYFQINGRLKMAEIRGCSDTYTALG
ncbi:MAG: acyl-protein synthetase [Lachnospiraceae bacterium]|jgi:phenylacetate-coenzyme A ligase PaaK-like adenylate-forming protein|nr:acyl-protein synthetase [Lachnospiraceae bacterium]